MGKVSERLVRALFIVGDDPVVDDVAHLAQGAEEVGVEDFVSKGAIESLDVGVLGWLAGLDVMKTNSIALTSGNEFERDEFRAVINPDLFRQSPAVLDLLQDSDDALRGQRGVDFDRESLAALLRRRR